MDAILSQKASAISTLPKPNIILYLSSVTDLALSGGEQKKRAAGVTPAALVMDVFIFYCLSTYPKTAGASKKAKAKKEKEAKAVLVRVHDDLSMQLRPFCQAVGNSSYYLLILVIFHMENRPYLTKWEKQDYKSVL